MSIHIGLDVMFKDANKYHYMTISISRNYTASSFRFQTMVT